MPRVARRRCLDCGGSGRCEDCHCTGVNLRLNDSEPRCRSCEGTGRCARCGGTGLPEPGSADDLSELLADTPVWVRLVLSVIPGFLLYQTLIERAPVHWGRGGPVIPTVFGQLIAVGICAPILYTVWKSLKLANFKYRKRPATMSLFGNPKEPPRK